MRMQGRREMKRLSTEEFYGSENTRYAITMMRICHYTFVQTHTDHTIPRVNPKVN